MLTGTRDTNHEINSMRTNGKVRIRDFFFFGLDLEEFAGNTKLEEYGRR